MHKQIFAVSKENYTITADVTLMNKDLGVIITGGDVPHLGGIVSYDHKSRMSEKIYFDSHDGRKHKDIFLAERFAERIQDRLLGNLCVTAGVHIDGITQAQIEASFPMTVELAQQVLDWTLEFENEFDEPQYTTHLKNFKFK